MCLQLLLTHFGLDAFLTEGQQACSHFNPFGDCISSQVAPISSFSPLDPLGQGLSILLLL